MTDKLEPQKALEAIKNCGVENQQVVLEYAYNMIKQMIDDYVPVVRCKDCKYWSQMDPGWGECDLDGRVMDSYWFCADGERKDGYSNGTKAD